MKRILKKYRIALLTAMLLPTVSSCEDFLNVPPVDALGAETFYQSPTQANQGVIGLYSKLHWISRDEFLWLSETRSDNMWYNVESNAVRPDIQLNVFTAPVTAAEFNTVWNEWYAVIYNANVILEKVSGATFDETFKKQVLGEAHFLRGWAYFELARLYGNVPVIDKTMSPDEVASVPQSTAKDVYNNIVIPDLSFARDNLPYDADMKDSEGKSLKGQGRADKLAAQAMLARVYMTMSGYPVNDASAKALAKSELKAVLDYAGYPNFNKYWAPDMNEWTRQFIDDETYNKYTIFAFQHRTNATGCGVPFDMSQLFPSTYISLRTTSTAEAFVEISLAAEFDRDNQADKRGWGASIESRNWPAGTGSNWPDPKMPEYADASNADVTFDFDLRPEKVEHTAYFYKFLPSIPKRTALGFSETDIQKVMTGSDLYRNYPINYPVIRMEDIALMYAEILASEGNNDEALAIVNKIRQRAGAAVVSAADGAVIDLIKRERRLEFVGEGIRWFDLVRWGDWKSTIQKMFERRRETDKMGSGGTIKEGWYLCPIPDEQMHIKPGLYNQNPDY